MVSAFTAICVSAMFLLTISAQCSGHPGIHTLAPISEALPRSLAHTLPNGPMMEVIPQYIPENVATFNGPSFQVTSYSSVGPTSMRVQSNNLAVEGPLTVTGKLPFLGVVTVEGPLPAVGQGAVSYECGNGNVGIVSEGRLGDGLGVSAGLAGLGYNAFGNGLPLGRF